MSNPVYQTILSHSITSSNQVRYKIDPRNIFDFFSSGLTKEKRIPDYQRPYSWDEQNVIDLFDDVIELSKKTTEDKSWFLGPIFSTYIDGDDFSYLLDGQQRSTTIMLILKEFTLLKYKIDEYSFDSSNISVKDRFERNVKHCQNCLTYTKGAGKEAVRLVTETASQEYFEGYIGATPKDETELKNIRKSLADFAEKLKEKGSNTASVINRNSNKIFELFQKLLQSTTFFENIESLNSFIEALLFHCWLIEIPIREDEYSINIFESINNRGKKLTLVDKLRFRSLILIKSSNNREKVKNLWKEVFSSLEKILSFGFIDDEEDFFRVLVNAISGESYTNDQKRLEFFEDSLFLSDDDILKFLENCLRVIEANLIIRDALLPASSFIKKFKNQEQSRVRAVLLLCEKMFKASDNSRFLFYRNAWENYTPQSYYPYVVGLWNNIRITFYYEIFVSETSNLVREEYLRILKNPSLLSQFIKGDYIKSNNLTLTSGANQLNIISNKNADRVQLILSIYSYFMDYNTLVNTLNNLFLKHVEVEHCIPKKWKKNWSSARFSYTHAMNYLSTYNSLNCPYLEYASICSLITAKGQELEFPDNEAPGQNCILEFIGNKWMIHSSDNKKGSNLGWQDKKDKVFENSKALKFPDNDDALAGYKLYSKFGYEEILDRSFKIADKIVENFQGQLF